jgi:HPt (histidine-containing phosphotransfer) domain-containing protein
MTAPVDLTDLRSMIDGDPELELALFQEFYSATEEHLQIMVSHCSGDENEIWRMTAHSIKGIAYNIGAKKLGDLCEQAQRISVAQGIEKQQLCNEIQREYLQVKAYLQAIPH